METVSVEKWASMQSESFLWERGTERVMLASGAEAWWGEGHLVLRQCQEPTVETLQSEASFSSLEGKS